jgi:hypothetical protein
MERKVIGIVVGMKSWRGISTKKRKIKENK